MGLTVWKNAGYYMLFFLAGLQTIPPESYEAAILDGANAWQRLRYRDAAVSQADARVRRS